MEESKVMRFGKMTFLAESELKKKRFLSARLQVLPMHEFRSKVHSAILCDGSHGAHQIRHRQIF